MRALFIQQDHVSPLGPVGERFAERGYDVVEFNVVPEERFASPDVEVDFPDPLAFDVVVPLGAPWSVYDRATIGSWIGDELALLRTAHEAGVPVLGICFGGQALAEALGGAVFAAPETEVGWLAIESDDHGLVEPGPWFQWHSDMVTPPPGAVVHARTSVCPQVYTLGRSMGLQFHPELTGDGLQGWLDFGGDVYLAENGYDADAMMAQTRAGEAAAAARTHRLVDAFLDRVATTP